MNDHTTALVPIETWAYASPSLRMAQQPIDVGLLAEALIYYDRVLLVPSSYPSSGRVLSESEASSGRHSSEKIQQARPPFIDIVDWFASRQELPELLALLQDRTITVYHYAFTTLPMLKDGVYTVWNAQDEEEAKEPTFMRRIAGHRSLYDVLPKARQREKLYRVLQDNVIERRADQFERAVENARRDSGDDVAMVTVLQAFVDEIRLLLPASIPERILATNVERTPERTKITYNINFDTITQALTSKLVFYEATPFIGLAQSNRILWSAALEYADLYLPSPLSIVSSLKLAESNDRRAEHQELVETLERKVEFPDIRRLVNEGKLSIKEVLVVRRHAAKFRKWLQTQAERDSDALIAYHHEVARASGLTDAGGKILRLFGALAGPIAAAYSSQYGLSLLNAGVIGAITAGVAPPLVEKGVDYVFDLAGKLDAQWKPVVFGDWAKAYVRRKTSSE